jgi:TolA-binding protein
MRNFGFITFCILLFAGFLQFYSFIHYKFSGIEVLRSEVSELKRSAQEEQLKAQLAQYQLEDYEQYVATVLPNEFKAYAASSENLQARLAPLRSLASIGPHSAAADIQIERASSLYERGRQAFASKKFDESNEIFTKLLSLYPSSIHAPDSYFLLAEGQFQSNDFEDTIKTIGTMVSLFPENELTGFALIRLGKIFESQERLEDAVDVYKAVLKSYPKVALQKQAQACLKAVQL